MEKHTKVEVYKVELFCDKCESKMIHNGMCLTTYPPKYPHKCLNEECNHVENYPNTYPTYVYKEVE